MSGTIEVRHHLSFVITAILLAILCGQSKISSIHRFINNRIDWLKKVTQIKQGKAISRAHLPRLIDKISWSSLDQIIQNHFELHLLPPGIDEEWKAITRHYTDLSYCENKPSDLS